MVSGELTVTDLAQPATAPCGRMFPEAPAAPAMRRLPPGVGLMVAALLSLGLWAGCVWAAAALANLAAR
jgi:hypothetical protein